MSGDGYGLPGSPQAVAPTTGATAQATASAPTTGANTTTPSNAGATPSPTSAPAGLLGDNSSSGFQLAAPTTTPGTDIMGTPSWMADYTKAGSPDLNTWYQQHQGGYADMSKPLATPAQLQFAPPPPPAAPAAAPAATPAAPAAPQGNWWSPKQGPAPAVTKNTLWGSTPVGQAELDALPDTFVASQSFLNQYGSSPGAMDYQRWRMGPQAYLAAYGQPLAQPTYGRTEHGN